MSTALPTASSAYGPDRPAAAATVDNTTPQGATYRRGNSVQTNGATSKLTAWMAHLAGELQKAHTHCERLSLHSAADRIFIILSPRVPTVALIFPKLEKLGLASWGYPMRRYTGRSGDWKTLARLPLMAPR